MTYDFCPTPQQIAFLNEFYIPFQCFNWQLFCWSHVSFQLGISNHLFKVCCKKSFNYRLICISRLLLVFVLEMQITRLFNDFPSTLVYCIFFSALLGKNIIQIIQTKLFKEYLMKAEGPAVKEKMFCIYLLFVYLQLNKKKKITKAEECTGQSTVVTILKIQRRSSEYNQNLEFSYFL